MFLKEESVIEYLNPNCLQPLFLYLKYFILLLLSALPEWLYLDNVSSKESNHDVKLM